jgi:hypothetical protein
MDLTKKAANIRLCIRRPEGIDSTNALLCCDFKVVNQILDEVRQGK